MEVTNETRDDVATALIGRLPKGCGFVLVLFDEADKSLAAGVSSTVSLEDWIHVLRAEADALEQDARRDAEDELNEDAPAPDLEDSAHPGEPGIDDDPVMN